MGFFGGLARGVRPFLIQRREQKMERELATHQREIDFYTKAAQRPDITPYEQGLIFERLGELSEVDPTTKKGKKAQGNILSQLGGYLKAEQEERAQPNRQSLVPAPESQTRPRKVADVPQRRTFTAEEQGVEELRKSLPELREKHRQAMELA